MKKPDYNKFVRERIAQLRNNIGQSAIEVSYALDKNKNYIGKIESQEENPSLEAFFCIIEYLGVDPWDFFDPANKDPREVRDLVLLFKDLEDDDRQHIKAICEKLAKKK